MRLFGCQITFNRAPRATLDALSARMLAAERELEQLRRQVNRTERKVYRAGEAPDELTPDSLPWKPAAGQPPREIRTGEHVP